jgi:muconolactone delta-isomerase
MSEWINRYNDKLEQVWGFSGIQGGGGIIRVESLDELDAILSEFPMGPFAEQEIYPLVELGDSLQRVKRAAQAMTAVGSK